MNIQLLNKIAPIGLAELDNSYQVGDAIQNPDGIMVRSAVMHETVFNPELLAIARAGAGVNNIPIDRCTEAGIVVFNTPGANANGVKELAVCALLLAARDVVGGIDWVKSIAGTPDVAKQVEKGKSKFAGTELMGKTLGVIGLGAIGGLIANAALQLGMKVIGCDPFLSVEAAWNLDHCVIRAATFDEIYEKSDYITLHVPATKDTKGMICADSIAKMKDGAKIINLARADLVNAAELKAALESGKLSAYVTDFPTEDILDAPHVVAIPHLGASTEESENNCAVMAARQLDDYLKNGNIRNSVNFPALEQPRTSAARLCVLHANIPAVITGITYALAQEQLNIENMTNKSKGENAYTMLDISAAPSDAALERIQGITGVYRVRVV
ncbi:MAG: 3-phosphoglycerate dehydrogenase [Ruminococcaceae bacterium]|nr:3-phosphoglycerate dehydrogenase [Oscillospiraceae bacterium]